MGNSCLLPASQRSIIINKTSIGATFFINPVSSLARYKRRRRSTVASLNSLDGPNSTQNLFSKRDKELIERCWRERISTFRRDLFHRTMLFCIEASPKITEVIACGRYCYRDLTRWPKLNRICQAQFAFFEKLIYVYNLDEKLMLGPCWLLGEMHANYAQFGLKLHFLDIYQQQLLAVIARMEMKDKAETCIAFTHLSTFVVEVMNQAYCQKCAEFRNASGNSMTF